MSKNESQGLLPYHTDIELLSKMLDDLKTSGKDGVNLNTLWVSIGAAKNSHRSYTMTLGRFLGLVDSDNNKVWLTDFGSTLRYMTKVERSEILATRLPEKYLTMFKWIRASEEMRSNEIKRKFIEAWGSHSSATVLDRAITTFLNYLHWLGLIVYQGRGNQAKGIITNLGKRVLDLPPDELKTIQSPIEDKSPDATPKGVTTLSSEAVYPIKIITRDREFDWDIKSETDLSVIDSVMISIKEGWKKTQQPLLEDDKVE